MADIICIECNANVSDVSGYCPECGYPFDNAPAVPNNAAEAAAETAKIADAAVEAADASVEASETVEAAVEVEAVVAVAPDDTASAAGPEAITAMPIDTIMHSLDAVRLEIQELQRRVTEIRQDTDSHSKATADSTQKTLTDIAEKLDSIVSANSAKEAKAAAEIPKKTKKELLSAFYKTLNSPNSMFEYMFYICIVQIIFVIINLFLVTYIVTLVR